MPWDPDERAKSSPQVVALLALTLVATWAFGLGLIVGAIVFD
jgi:hypothetical protein